MIKLIKTQLFKLVQFINAYFTFLFGGSVILTFIIALFSGGEWNVVLAIPVVSSIVLFIYFIVYQVILILKSQW